MVALGNRGIGSPIPAGPFTGVNDAPDSDTSTPNTLQFAQNVYPDPQAGTYVGRPAFVVTGSSGSGQQLGSVSYRRSQGGGQWTERNSDGSTTRRTIQVVGGQFYQYDWAGDTWTEIVNAAAFTAASITLDKVARVYFTVISNTLFVSDGVNKPWTWDGTTNAGLTSCTNCPVLFGQPVVYYAKIFGIKNANRGRIVWSEENAANIGYESAPWNDFWDIAQTDSNPLFGLVAKNDALYVYRERSVTAVTGRVDTQFATTGTRSGVSNTVGIESSGTLVFHEDRVLFLDADGRPRLQSGSVVDDSIWRDCKQTIAGLNQGAMSVAQGVDYTQANLILFGVPETGQSDMSMILCLAISAQSSPYLTSAYIGAKFASIWRINTAVGSTFTSMSSVVDQNGVPTIMVGNASGYVFRLGSPDSGPWDDVPVGGTKTAIIHAIQTDQIGPQIDTDYRFTRADVVFRTRSTATYGFSYQTPRGAGGTGLQTMVTASGSTYGAKQYGAFTYGGGIRELKRTFGLGVNALGRYLYARLDHSGLGEQFGVERMSVEAIPASRQPYAP
jgi:hypothetical protein